MDNKILSEKYQDFYKWLRTAKNTTKFVLGTLVEFQKNKQVDTNGFVSRKILAEKFDKVAIGKKQNLSQVFSHNFDKRVKIHLFLQKAVEFLPKNYSTGEEKTHYKVKEEYLDFLYENLDKLKNGDNLLEEKNDIINKNIGVKNTKKFEKEVELLNNKKQIILYGPPGTGKTYNIKTIIEEHSGGENYEDLKKDGKVEFITFHQSFSYEEFIEGIKPDLENDSQEISYQIEDGIFKKILEKAKINKKTNFDDSYNKLLEEIENLDGGILKLKTKTGKEFGISINSKGSLNLHTGKDFKKQGSLTKENLRKQAESNENVYDYWESYFYSVINYLKEKYNYSDLKQLTKTKNYYLIIDEINRGNISKIFGELITLLEADKRNKNWKTKLPYSKKDFWIPENLYIIATMNTSDKSIVSLDTALRRRFGFVEMLPDYNLEELEKKIKGIKLANILEKLNNRIEYLLDKDHLIGHSYFLQKIENIGDLKRIFINEIYPLLEEYFYSEEENIRKVLGKNFFEEQKIDSNLFEEKIEEEEKKYIFKKNITNEEFEEILKNY